MVVDPNGNRTTFACDAADRLTTQTDPRGATTTFAYDAADQLVDTTDRNGRRTTFAYDSGGRRTAERWLSGVGGTIRTNSSTYNAAGELTGVTDLDATLTFTYDSGGRQASAATSSTAGQPAVTLTSTYDGSDNRTVLVDNLASVGRTTYAYDAVRNVTQIARSIGGVAGPRVDYAYDAGDRRTTLTRTIGGAGTEVRTALKYDDANRVTTIAHDSNTYIAFGNYWVTTPLATYTYGYDNANRLTSEANAEGTVTYAYDVTDQLTGASGSRAETYTYDPGGNRTMAGYADDAGNRLTDSPGYTYTYDAEGNLASKTQLNGAGTADDVRTDYTWDYRDRLTGVTRKNSGGPATMQATYTYDALDRRIGTKVDADGAGAGAAVQGWTAYDGANTYADFNSAGTLQQRYLYGPAVDALLARTASGGTTAWYLADKLGTVRDIASTAGSVIDHLSYDSNGKVLSESQPANGDRFKFTGREYDAHTGDYYYRARYFDPATGRFIGQDPKGFAAGDANLYRYVGNGPTNATDPSGKEAMTFVATMSIMTYGSLVVGVGFENAGCG